MEIVGYTISDLQESLDVMETVLPPGERILLSLCTGNLPDTDSLEQFYAHATLAGHHLSRPVSDIIDGVPVTSFEIQKGSPALALLVPLIPMVLIGGLVTFGITQIQSISKALLPLVLVVVGGAVVIAIALRNPAERVATKYFTKVSRETKDHIKSPRKPSTPLFKEEAERIRDLFYNKRLTYREISRLTGRSLSVISNHVHEHARDPLKEPITQDRLDEVVGLRKMGLSLEDIGRRLTPPRTRTFVWHLLRMATQRANPGATANDLAFKLGDISDYLFPPTAAMQVSRATISRAILELKDVADMAHVYMEGIPTAETEEEEGSVIYVQLSGIHWRALQAESVLRNGMWCLTMLESGRLAYPDAATIRLWDSLNYRPKQGEKESAKFIGCFGAAMKIAHNILEAKILRRPAVTKEIESPDYTLIPPSEQETDVGVMEQLPPIIDRWTEKEATTTIQPEQDVAPAPDDNPGVRYYPDSADDCCGSIDRAGLRSALKTAIDETMTRVRGNIATAN